MEHQRFDAIPIWTRLKLAVRIIFDVVLARKVWQAACGTGAVSKPPSGPTEQAHASGLLLLAALQREGRMIDFLQQEVSGFSDAEVGAAARVVHAGCRKVLREYFTIEPALAEPEDTMVTIPENFDAHRIRLTGNVAGKPPFHGAVKHHGWVAKEVRLPGTPELMNLRILTPAEVELA